jgi:hypothetical protein
MDQPMQVARSISSGPHRSAEQTCTGIAEFIADVLRSREYPDVAKVRSRFEQVFPLLRFLITARRFGDPAVTVAMQDLDVAIYVNYDPQFEEDLTPPNLVLLDSLTAADLIKITLHADQDVTGQLGQLPADATGDGIHFELIHGAGAAGDALVETLHADTVPEHADTVPEIGTAPKEEISTQMTQQSDSKSEIEHNEDQVPFASDSE